jgi:hypothetical protein
MWRTSSPATSTARPWPHPLGLSSGCHIGTPPARPSMQVPHYQGRDVWVLNPQEARHQLVPPTADPCVSASFPGFYLVFGFRVPSRGPEGAGDSYTYQVQKGGPQRFTPEPKIFGCHQEGVPFRPKTALNALGMSKAPYTCGRTQAGPAGSPEAPGRWRGN